MLEVQGNGRRGCRDKRLFQRPRAGFQARNEESKTRGLQKEEKRETLVRNFQVDSMGLTMPGHWGGRKNEESRVMLSSVGAASRPRVFECNRNEMKNLVPPSHWPQFRALRSRM